MHRKLFGNGKKKAFLYDNVVILPLYSTSQSILLKIGYMYDLLVGGVLFVFCCVLWSLLFSWGSIGGPLCQ